MRLTVDALLHAEHQFNAYMDRELSLRGFKIPTIENLSVLQDQYDVIDFSDNDVKRLENFPLMTRLNALLFHNNSITRISKTVGTMLPKVTSLVLTNNKVSSLSEIDNIATLKQLEILSLMENPVALKPNYRLYVIHKIPTIKYLDFRKVQQKERDESTAFFKSAVGKAFIAAVEQEGKRITQAASTGGSSTADGGIQAATAVLTGEQKELVKRVIENATTKEEIDIIERQLKAGNFSFILAAPEEQVAADKDSDSRSSKLAALAGNNGKKRKAGDIDQQQSLKDGPAATAAAAEPEKPLAEQYDSMNVD